MGSPWVPTVIAPRIAADCEISNVYHSSEHEWMFFHFLHPLRQEGRGKFCQMVLTAWSLSSI